MRTCGECSLCCKLLGVYSNPDDDVKLDKPANQWCTHCDRQNGCKIYETRPKPCINFECLWLQNPTMSEDLRPDRSHVIFFELTDDIKGAAHTPAFVSKNGAESADAVLMEDPNYYGITESLKNPSIGKAVETIINSGYRLVTVNKSDGRLISKLTHVKK